MKIEPRSLPGFMELNPDEQILFNKMVDTIRKTYEKYGFWPLDTPVIEYSNVLLAKAGGETEKQIYRFNKGDNDLSLRFDLTVPLAKYVASRYNTLTFPFKRYQIGKVYRGERPQKGRYREFYQCDVDIIGDEVLSLRYDAEVPMVIYDIFKKFDFGDFVIRINNRKILNGFFNSLGLNDISSDILRIIDKIEKIGEEEVRRELKEYNIDEDEINKIITFINIKGSNSEIISELKGLNISDEVFNNGVYELESVINYLNDMDIDEKYYNIDLTIARGLDYYTGSVYETRLIDYPSIGSVCSGGRYDNLAEYYTDKKLPGVGISIGLTRLFYQLMEAGIIKKDNSGCADAIIVPMDNIDYKYVYSIASLIRNDFRVDICYLDNKKFKNKMKYVDNSKVKFAIIIGEDEVNNNYVTIKNMVSGEQNMVKKEEINSFILENM